MKIYPFDSRVGLLHPGGLYGLEFGAMVSLRSYHFYSLLARPDTRTALRERAIARLKKVLPGTVRLSGKKRLNVYASFVDFAPLAFRSPALIRNIRLERPKGV